MNHSACREREFTLDLGQWTVRVYTTYLHWLRHLLRRLGREATLAVWKAADAEADALMQEILSTRWRVTDAARDIEAELARQLAIVLPGPIGEMSPQGADALVQRTPPLRQIRSTFPDRNVERQITTFEAIHLGFDGLARLAEALIARHGKEGELIAYDLAVERRIAEEARTGSVAEFMSDFVTYDVDPIYTTGVKETLVRASEEEVVLHVEACEWARYFRAFHPRVGYLLACSTDEATYRAFNPRLRLQRTGTLMEGAPICDFGVYAVDE
jgi:hypothetical protein